MQTSTLVELPRQLAKRVAVLETQVRGLHQFRTGGTLPLDKKAKDQSFWDVEYLRAGVGQQKIVFFNNRIFGPGPQVGATKTESEFNLKTEGTFPTPQEYTIYGLKVRAMRSIVGVGLSPATLEALRSYAIIRYRQGQRNIFNFRLDDMSAPGFIGGSNAASAGGYLNMGPAGLSDWRPFSVTLPIKSGLSFAWEVETAPEFDVDEDIRLQIEMIGQLVDNTR